MAISDADLGGRGWYSERLRTLDDQPEAEVSAFAVSRAVSQ
jgi:hypothetical protein